MRKIKIQVVDDGNRRKYFLVKGDDVKTMIDDLISLRSIYVQEPEINARVAASRSSFERGLDGLAKALGYNGVEIVT